MTTIITDHLDPAYDYHVRQVDGEWQATELGPGTSYVLLPERGAGHLTYPCTIGAAPDRGPRTWLEYRERRGDLGMGPTR